MTLVVGYDAAVANWVQAQIPHAVNGFGPCVALGIAIDDVLIAGVVYHEWRPAYRSVQMSIAAASPKWATKGNLRAIFAYPFLDLKANRATAITPKRNRRARHLIEGTGFKLEGCARKGFLSDDAVIYGMLRNECRWIDALERQ